MQLETNIFYIQTSIQKCTLKLKITKQPYSWRRKYSIFKLPYKKCTLDLKVAQLPYSCNAKSFHFAMLQYKKQHLWSNKQ